MGTNLKIMLQFISNHGLEVGTAILAAASEIIGISPLKSNSVVQLVLNLLGSILKKK